MLVPRTKPRPRLSLQQRIRLLYAALFPEGHTPLAVSLSVFLGVFIGVLPTIGFALPLTVLATAICRVPKGPGLVSSFVATPPTLFLVFFPLGYLLGQRLVHPPETSVALLEELRHVTLRTLGEVSSRLWVDARPHVLAFVLGIFIVSFVTALIVAAVTYWVILRRARARAQL